MIERSNHRFWKAALTEQQIETAPKKERQEMTLLEEFAKVKHAIPYQPHVDKTPVGLIFSVLTDLPGLVGPSPVVFVCVVVMVCLFVFPKLLIVLLFVILGTIGITWIFAIALTSNTQIKADVAGISLPLIYLVSMKGELDRDWTELREVAFMRDELPSYDPTTLVFLFSDGARATFQVDGFTRSDFERLMLVINSFCPTVRRRPELDDLSSSLLAPAPVAAVSKDGLSFTELWQQELSMRFGTTAFVPHESGDRIMDGQLRILGQVAFGGLSAIYLAEWQGKGTVIVKQCVLPESADDVARAKYLQLFNREANLLARIDHPRIAHVYDSFVEDNRHYLLLEYIEGKNLRTYVQELGIQPDKTIAGWADEIADILVYLHGMTPPVIHRDLTPDNMIVSRDGGITIIDLGAANEFLGTVTGTVVGKNSYMPIEQFRGKATPRSDIYAFGATLYFLLTGKDPTPFSQSSPIKEGIEVSPLLDDLVRESTAVEPEDRIKDTVALAQRTKEIRNVFK